LSYSAKGGHGYGQSRKGFGGKKRGFNVDHKLKAMRDNYKFLDFEFANVRPLTDDEAVGTKFRDNASLREIVDVGCEAGGKLGLHGNNKMPTVFYKIKMIAPIIDPVTGIQGPANKTYTFVPDHFGNDIDKFEVVE
jgi:hypothetical protein